MISRRPKAGARGGFGGAGAPPTPSSIITTTITRRSSGARGRRPAHAWGSRPPDTIKNYYNNILQRGRRPSSRGGCGGAGAPPLPNSSRRPKNFRRPAGGSGGAEPGWVGGPGTIIQNHKYIITTVFYNLKNLNNIINAIIFSY